MPLKECDNHPAFAIEIYTLTYNFSSVDSVCSKKVVLVVKASLIAQLLCGEILGKQGLLKTTQRYQRFGLLFSHKFLSKRAQGKKD